LAILVLALTAPSLWQGWVADDLIHRQLLLTWGLPALLKGLFVFVTPDKSLQLMELSTDLGTLPWWTLDSLRIAFFRPVTVLTHWLDYQLWPDSSLLMHAQSILWYGGVCALATLIYRRLMGLTWVAGLAAFLFAVDTVHLGSVSWLANRNGLLGIFFSLLALLFHDRWRREGEWTGILFSGFWLALALLSAESSLAMTGYFLAYALFLDRGTRYRRLGSFVPCAAVVAVWLVVYRHLGYGTSGSGFYLDPVQEPGPFTAAVLERAPILLLGQWLGQIPMLYNLLSLPATRVVWVIAMLSLVVMGLALAPLLRRDHVACFWATGMMFAVIPACSIRLLSGRLLLFASLGAMGLIGQFTGGLLDQADWLPVHRAWRTPAWMLGLLLIGLHAILPLVLIPTMITIPDTFQTVIAQVTEIGSVPEAKRQDVVIVNAPSPFHSIYVPGLRSARHQPMPAHIRILSPGYFSVNVTRLDAHTVAVRPEHGYLTRPGTMADGNPGKWPPVHLVYVYQHVEKFFRSDAFPMTLGQRVELTGMVAEVTALTDDGRPAEARIQFTRPLEDPSMIWLQWDWEKGIYVLFVPPKIGETVRIRGAF